MNNNDYDSYFECPKINGISYFSMLFEKFILSHNVYHALSELTNNCYSDKNDGQVYNLKFVKKRKQMFNKNSYDISSLTLNIYMFIDMEIIVRMSMCDYTKIMSYIFRLNDIWIYTLKHDSNIEVIDFITPLVFCC